MDTIYTDALRAEFWREFESMVRVHFMPFVGNVKAVWQWDKTPDTQSVEHLGTKLSVTLAECSRARMRVVVVPVIPWKSDAKEHAVEWEPDDGEPEGHEERDELISSRFDGDVSEGSERAGAVAQAEVDGVAEERCALMIAWAGGIRRRKESGRRRFGFEIREDEGDIVI